MRREKTIFTGLTLLRKRREEEGKQKAFKELATSCQNKEAVKKWLAAKAIVYRSDKWIFLLRKLPTHTTAPQEEEMRRAKITSCSVLLFAYRRFCLIFRIRTIW